MGGGASKMDEMTGRLKKIKALIDAGDLEGALEECGAVKKAVMFRNPDPSMPQKLTLLALNPSALTRFLRSGLHFLLVKHILKICRPFLSTAATGIALEPAPSLRHPPSSSS